MGQEIVMTLVNDCNCTKTGECTCEDDVCNCECGCDTCETEYTACACGGNCGCGTDR